MKPKHGLALLSGAAVVPVPGANAASLRASLPALAPMSSGARMTHRYLLALEGTRLSPELLTEALRQCVRLTDRLDILLVNPPREPTFLLGSLLLRLEHSGVDYRLASTDGDLGGEVMRYLHRFQGVTTVLVEDLPPLETAMGVNLQRLGQKGYRFVGLSAPRPRGRGG